MNTLMNQLDAVPINREVLDCGSPLPLWKPPSLRKAAEGCRTPRRWRALLDRRLLPCATLLAWLLALPAVAQDDVSQKQARSAPEWLRQSVIYEVFPRAFSAQGDFNGITEKVPELKDLGVNVLWLMPIHPIGEAKRKGSLGSPYAIRDYYAINPEFGTAQDFKRLVETAHRHGMKVILDLVANHTAWDSVMMKHPEFYKQDAAGNILSPVPEWSDVAGLNYANPKLRQYMIEMLEYWVREFNVDGFRCDVASMVPTGWWEEARAALEKLKPDILMLAEASKPELLLQAFDLDYAWPFHSTLNNVLLRGAPASAFQQTWQEVRDQFPQGALHLQISDNHDEARAVARFGIRGALAAQALMLTLDGVPLFYNGMEVGDATESGDPALFEKLPIFWKPKERPPLREIYRGLIQLRRAHPAFTNDRVVWLINSQPADLVTFMRLDEQDEFVVVINFSNRPLVGWVEVMNADHFKAVRLPGVPEATDDAFPLFRLNGFEFRIYHRAVPR